MIEKVHFILLSDGKNIGCEKCAFVVPVYEVLTKTDPRLIIF